MHMSVINRSEVLRIHIGYTTNDEREPSNRRNTSVFLWTLRFSSSIVHLKIRPSFHHFIYTGHTVVDETGPSTEATLAVFLWYLNFPISEVRSLAPLLHYRNKHE